MKKDKYRASFVGAALAAVFTCSVAGCSSNQQTPNEASCSAAIAENDQAAAVNAQAPAVVMPFELRIEGSDAGDNTRIRVFVTYRYDVDAEPTLALKTNPPHGVIGSPQVSLKTGAKNTEIAKEFIVTGKNPEVEAVVRYETNGFAAEIRESYPTTYAKKRALEPAKDSRSPLPAPIDIDGQAITHGVEVKPQ